MTIQEWEISGAAICVMLVTRTTNSKGEIIRVDLLCKQDGLLNSNTFFCGEKKKNHQRVTNPHLILVKKSLS